jgi:hypothetical protein
MREEDDDDRISDRPGGKSRRGRDEDDDDRIADRPSARKARRRDEDEEDDDRFDARTEFPRSVWAAGVIWIIFGGLILLITLVNVVANLALTPSAPPGTPAGAQGAAAAAQGTGLVCTLLFGAFVGGVFVHVGVQSVNGTAKDTLGNGVGSMIFALLYGGWAVVALLAALVVGGTLGIILVIGGGVNIISGVALLIAGILALIGRADYKAWRRAQKRSRRDD